MSDECNDTNLGDPRDTPDEKEICRLESKVENLLQERDAPAARLADAEKVIAHFLHVWEETECEHDDVMPVVDASRAFLATKPKEKQ